MDLAASIGAIWSASDLTTDHKAVLTVVRYHADEDGNCRVTFDRIESMTGLARRTVMRRLADLVARQVIGRMTDKRGGNTYRLDLSRVTLTPQTGHADPSVGSQGPLSRVTLTPQTGHADPSRLIDVLCGSDVATRTTELRNETTASTARTPPRETLAPHPMPTPTPHHHDGSDRVEFELRAAAIIGRHPSADQLTPMAVEAIRILRVDPSIFVLEQWLTRGYSLPRIVAGCTFAASKFHGQTVPAGELVNSATRWMNRATPDEYGEKPRPGGTTFADTKPPRAHSSAGIWAKFNMPIPKPNTGTDGEF